MKGLSRHQTKAIIKRELKAIKNGRDEGGALQKKHAEWNEDARKNGEALKKKLIGEAATVQYAVDHPKMSGRQVVEKTHTKMSKYAVDMARMRQMEDEGNVSDLENIISTKKHHLLANDEEKKILIFGDDSALQRLAATPLIHADGTFRCVLFGFKQLYVFHATVENNVSVPVLFCLVRGKKKLCTRSSSG